MKPQCRDNNQCHGKRREEPGAEDEFAAEIGAQEDCYDRGKDGISERQGENNFAGFWGGGRHGMKPEPLRLCLFVLLLDCWDG